MADFDIPNARRPRQFRRIDRFTETDDPEEIRRRFRFTPDSIDRIERLIGHRLERPTGRNQPLTPRQQILITLRFFASGNFLQLIGDTFGVDIATVSRVVTRVTDELCDLKDQTIKFPTTDRHKSIIKQNFFQNRWISVCNCGDRRNTRSHHCSPWTRGAICEQKALSQCQCTGNVRPSRYLSICTQKFKT
jgi:hypothetical protein